jgi:hypothetical protein
MPIIRTSTGQGAVTQRCVTKAMWITYMMGTYIISMMATWTNM